MRSPSAGLRLARELAEYGVHEAGDTRTAQRLDDAHRLVDGRERRHPRQHEHLVRRNEELRGTCTSTEPIPARRMAVEPLLEPTEQPQGPV